MELENQVCSLELAKRLKELGVKQESLVYWLNIQHCIHTKVKEDGFTVETDEKGNVIIDRIEYRISLGSPFAWDIDEDNTWSAFTLSEILEMMPLINACSFQLMKGISFAECEPRYYARYDQLLLSCEEIEQNLDKNPANSCAKMLIHLLENKLMELPQ